MKRLQQIWSQVKAVYAKLPDIIHFVLAMVWLLFTWSVIAKVVRVLWHQLDKLKRVRQVEPYFDKFVVYLPFVLIAVLFLMAFNRIVELLKK